MYVRSFVLAALALSLGCGESSSTEDGGTDTPDMLPASQCQAIAPTCTGEQIQDLDLFKAPSPATRMVTNTADGTGFSSTVDAVGGGHAPTESYVYAKFTPTGLVKVDLGDEAAFASTAWDIAFRRFVVRLNSGVSGPSCVTGARTPVADYSTISSVPAGLQLASETYYSSSCALVADDSGLGSPGTLLATFWTYQGCVRMTNSVYVIQTAEGKKLKLTVDRYYDGAVQAACDTSGMMSVDQGAAAAHIGLRWAYLP